MSRRAQTGRVQRHSSASVRPGAVASSLPRPVRIVAFAGIAAVVGILAVSLVVGRLAGPTQTDATAISVRADMGGFDPAALTVRAGETVRIEFASLDTSFHSDGGGWHQFAIDEFGIDWKVGPQSGEVFELTAPAEPGSYSWYCDICCGGKENPTMRGTLTVGA